MKPGPALFLNAFGSGVSLILCFSFFAFFIKMGGPSIVLSIFSLVIFIVLFISAGYNLSDLDN